MLVKAVLIETVRVPLKALRLFPVRLLQSRGRKSVNRSLESTTKSRESTNRGVSVPIEVVKALIDV
jgi:hypothetical protein